MLLIPLFASQASFLMPKKISYIDIMLAEEVFWFWILKFKLTRFLSFLLMGNITIILIWAEILQISLDIIYCFLSLHCFHPENRVVCSEWRTPTSASALCGTKKLSSTQSRTGPLFLNTWTVERTRRCASRGTPREKWTGKLIRHGWEVNRSLRYCSPS